MVICTYGQIYYFLTMQDIPVWNDAVSTKVKCSNVSSLDILSLWVDILLNIHGTCCECMHRVRCV